MFFLKTVEKTCVFSGSLNVRTYVGNFQFLLACKGMGSFDVLISNSSTYGLLCQQLYNLLTELFHMQVYAEEGKTDHYIEVTTGQSLTMFLGVEKNAT